MEFSLFLLFISLFFYCIQNIKTMISEFVIGINTELQEEAEMIILILKYNLKIYKLCRKECLLSTKLLQREQSCKKEILPLVFHNSTAGV